MAMRYDQFRLLRNMSRAAAECARAVLYWPANTAGVYLPADIGKDLREPDMPSAETEGLTHLVNERQA